MKTTSRARVALAGVLLWASLPQAALAHVVSRLVVARPGLAFSGGLGVRAGSFKLRTDPLQGVVPFLDTDKAVVVAPLVEGPKSLSAVTVSRVLAPVESVAAGFKLADGRGGVFAAKTRLDAAFDSGSLPTSEEVLARADSQGVPREAVAGAIKESFGFPEALRKLETLGLLKPGEVRLEESLHELSAPYLLSRLWSRTAKATVAQDARWPIPSLKAVRGGVVYHIHPVIHGQHLPNRPWRVRRLVAALKAAGLPLYSEQNLAAFFGYDYGQETLDHAAADGSRAALRALPERGPLALVDRLLKLALLPGSLAVSLGALFLDPSALWPWVAAPAAALLNWLAATGFTPWISYYYMRLPARAVRRLGLADQADHSDALGRLLMRRRPGLEEILKSDLPMPLHAALDREPTRRSKAMAAAVAADAEAKGAKEVHILAGHNHAFELAWYLENEGPTR